MVAIRVPQNRQAGAACGVSSLTLDVYKRQAARATEKALADGKYLIDPHVTITITQSRNQKVSVLGEVGTPGRYPIDSNTTIFDLLALAGGARETSSDVVFLLRPDADGKINR